MPGVDALLLAFLPFRAAASAERVFIEGLKNCWPELSCFGEKAQQRERMKTIYTVLARHYATKEATSMIFRPQKTNLKEERSFWNPVTGQLCGMCIANPI